MCQNESLVMKTLGLELKKTKQRLKPKHCNSRLDHLEETKNIQDPTSLRGD